MGDGNLREGSDPESRAEFYLCLARAFAAPRETQAYDGLRHYLADDLATLAEDLGYPVAGEIADYRRAMAAIAGHQALLQLYARLFLTPPAPVAINSGLYLDGAMLGPSELALRRWYGAHGLGTADNFHDLSDHVTTQLEFVSYLLGMAARQSAAGAADAAMAAADEAADFLRTYPMDWLPAFLSDLKEAGSRHELEPVYLVLARILAKAVAADVDLEPDVAGMDGLVACADRDAATGSG